MAERYGIEYLRREFYDYGYEHKDMLSCIGDALARLEDKETLIKDTYHVRFDLLEVFDDLTYKHRAINTLIEEVHRLRKELNGLKK